MADSSKELLTNNLFFLSAAFSRKLSRQADDVFASIGLSSSHALLLLLIHREPEIQPGALADKISLKPSTITRLVQKLEQRELVNRESKGRATAVTCTSKGNDLTTDIENKWQELLDKKRDQLGDRYVEVLSEMISNALEKVEK